MYLVMYTATSYMVAASFNLAGRQVQNTKYLRVGAEDVEMLKTTLIGTQALELAPLCPSLDA